MLDAKQETDLFDEASNPPEKTYDLFGKVEIKAWECGFTPGIRGGQPYDPAFHKKRHIMIDIYIQPLAEIDVKYPKSLEFHDVTWSNPWARIVLPSIKALGFENVREINGKWARVAHVPDGGSYQRKDTGGNFVFNPDGSPSMVETTTFKFVAFFADENACRAAYLAAGGAPANGNGHNAPAAEDAERVQARNIMTVVINNVAPGKTTFAEVQEAIKAHAFYPHISKHYPVESVETMAMITDITKLLPF